MIDSQQTDIPFYIFVEVVEKAITSAEGWNKLAKAIKNSGNPNARLKCLSILKIIATKQAIEQGKEKEIFVNLVKTLDQHLND